MMRLRRFLATVASLLVVVGILTTAGRSAQATPPSTAIDRLLAGRFQWVVSPPLVAPVQRPDNHCYSVKDPSIVFHQGRWHLFCTTRGKPHSHQIEYLSFTDWQDANAAPRCVVAASDGYFCAPQVFYFTPQKKWYLVCQASDPAWEPNYQAAYSTTDDIGDPASWSKLAPLGARPANGKTGLDFWVVCDTSNAHLLFTTLDGHMWREQTRLADFPRGWSEPELAIEGDIFEASHTYKLKGLDRYLTLVEAQHGHGWRYYKAYLADRLEGPWVPLAATKDKAFASMANTQPSGPRWTDNISHIELLRSGFDQSLEVDPANLRVLFQGVSEKARQGKSYGLIPWRLGLLTPEKRK